MLFAIVIVLVLVYINRVPQAPVGEYGFMLSAFAGLAYVAGFLDSRIFARLDKKNANRLAEVEARFEKTWEDPDTAAAP